VTVELRRLSTDFPSTLPLAASESRCARFTSPVLPDIRFLSSHRHMEKEFEVTRGVEDHVEYIPFNWRWVANMPWRVYTERPIWGRGARRGGRRLVESDATVYQLDEGAPVLDLFRERD